VPNLFLDHQRKKSSRQRDVNTTISPEGEEEAMMVRMSDRSASSNPERSVISREVRESRQLRRKNGGAAVGSSNRGSLRTYCSGSVCVCPTLT
jgi:hypothetical protein